MKLHKRERNLKSYFALTKCNIAINRDFITPNWNKVTCKNCLKQMVKGELPCNCWEDYVCDYCKARNQKEKE